VSERKREAAGVLATGRPSCRWQSKAKSWPRRQVPGRRGEINAANCSLTPSTHFSNGLASDAATELGDETTVVANGEGRVAGDHSNDIFSSKPVHQIPVPRR
jgi:hypothetical protein